MVEIGHDQGAASRRFFREAGLADVTVHPDINRKDRVVAAPAPPDAAETRRDTAKPAKMHCFPRLGLVSAIPACLDKAALSGGTLASSRRFRQIPRAEKTDGARRVRGSGAISDPTSATPRTTGSKKPMRSSKNRSRSKGNRNRSVGNIVNRVFDSSGPRARCAAPRSRSSTSTTSWPAMRSSAMTVSRSRTSSSTRSITLRMLAEAQREMEARREQQQNNQQPAAEFAAGWGSAGWRPAGPEPAEREPAGQKSAGPVSRMGASRTSRRR
jgi:hypothetical protein